MSEHRHYLKLEITYEHTVEDDSCVRCAKPVSKGVLAGIGTVETCLEPGVPHFGVWCIACAKEIALTAAVKK